MHVMSALSTAPQSTEMVKSPTTRSVCGFKQVENQQGFNCCFQDEANSMGSAAILRTQIEAVLAR